MSRRHYVTEAPGAHAHNVYSLRVYSLRKRHALSDRAGESHSFMIECTGEANEPEIFGSRLSAVITITTLSIPERALA